MKPSGSALRVPGGVGRRVARLPPFLRWRLPPICACDLCHKEMTFSPSHPLSSPLVKDTVKCAALLRICAACTFTTGRVGGAKETMKGIQASKGIVQAVCFLALLKCQLLRAVHALCPGLQR